MSLVLEEKGMKRKKSEYPEKPEHKQFSVLSNFPGQCWNFLTIYGGQDPSRKRFSYRPAKLHRLAESIPWKRFLGTIEVLKYSLMLRCAAKVGSKASSFLRCISVSAQAPANERKLERPEKPEQPIWPTTVVVAANIVSQKCFLRLKTTQAEFVMSL
jgi:hypothetical protein